MKRIPNFKDRYTKHMLACVNPRPNQQMIRLAIISDRHVFNGRDTALRVHVFGRFSDLEELGDTLDIAVNIL